MIKTSQISIPLCSTLILAQILLEENERTFVYGSLINSPETRWSGLLCFVLVQKGLLQQRGCWFIAPCHPCDITGMPLIWSVGIWAISWESVEWSWGVYELASFSTGIQGFWLSAKYFAGVDLYSMLLAFFGTWDEEGKTSQKENTLWRSFWFWGIARTCPELILSGGILFFAPVFWISLFFVGIYLLVFIYYLKKKNQQNTNQTKQIYQNEKISLFLVHLLIVYFCCVGVVASRYEIIFCFFLDAKLFYQ